MLVVERLGGAEGAAGREAEAAVGLALERGEVVEQRRLLDLRLRLERLDHAGLPARGGGDRLGRRGRGRGGWWSPRATGPCSRSRRRSRSRPRPPSSPRATNAAIARSRFTISASVGVCTRPSDSTLRIEPAFVVAARVAFMPTSQSASLRARAAASSGSICSSSRSASNASRIAFWVIELNQARRTGFSRAAFGAVSRMSLKMSSPSRPASQALTITSTSGRFIRAWRRLQGLGGLRVARLVAELLRQDREVVVASTSCNGRRRRRDPPARPGGRRRRRRSRPDPPSGRRRAWPSGRCSALATSWATDGFSQMTRDGMAAQGSTGFPGSVQPPPAAGRTGPTGPATTASTRRQMSSGTVFSTDTASERATSPMRAALQRDHPAEAALGHQLGRPLAEAGGDDAVERDGGAAALHVPEHDRPGLRAGSPLRQALGEHARPPRPSRAGRARSRRPRRSRPPRRAPPPRSRPRCRSPAARARRSSSARTTASTEVGCSGIRIAWAPPASPDSSAIQPACRPITSTTITRSCDSAVVCRRSIASVAICTAVQKPNVKSVPERSLSIVFGTPDHLQPVLGVQPPGHAERVLAPDRDERVEAEVGEGADALLAAALRLEGVGARAAEDGAAAGQDRARRRRGSGAGASRSSRPRHPC